MMRHLTTLVLAGVLGTLVLAEDASACHKKRCGCAAPACGPVVTPCPRPVVYRQPVACNQPVVARGCGHKAARCGGCGGGGLFGKHGHKRNCSYVTCATPVVYNNYTYNYGAPAAPSGQMMATPQK